MICCRGLTRRLPWGEPEHHRACQEYVRFAASTVRSLIDGRDARTEPALDGGADGGIPDPCATCSASG